VADEPKAQWVDDLPDDEAAATAEYLRFRGESNPDLDAAVREQADYRRDYERRTLRRQRGQQDHDRAE
jgi:hypothetical protein